MAEFKKLIITKKGQEAINNSLLSSQFLSFTKICSSSNVYSDTDILELTNLENIKQTVNISSVTKIDSETIQVEATINNTEVKEGYSMNSLGLFINYNDEDILYGVASVESTDKGSYIPPFNEKVPTGAYIKLLSTITDTSTIKFNIDPTGQATLGDIAKLQKNINEVNSKIPTSVSTLINDANYQTQEQVETYVNNKVSAVFKYKGSVNDYSKLPTNAEIGDTYNITNVSSHNKAGDNAVWNGTEWDVLSGIIDLSSYATKDEIPKVPTKMSELTNDTLIECTSEEEALRLSSQNPSKIYYWPEA